MFWPPLQRIPPMPPVKPPRIEPGQLLYVPRIHAARRAWEDHLGMPPPLDENIYVQPEPREEYPPDNNYAIPEIDWDNGFNVIKLDEKGTP